MALHGWDSNLATGYSGPRDLHTGLLQFLRHSGGIHLQSLDYVSGSIFGRGLSSPTFSRISPNESPDGDDLVECDDLFYSCCRDMETWGVQAVGYVYMHPEFSNTWKIRDEGILHVSLPPDVSDSTPLDFIAVYPGWSHALAPKPPRTSTFKPRPTTKRDDEAKSCAHARHNHRHLCSLLASNAVLPSRFGIPFGYLWQNSSVCDNPLLVVGACQQRGQSMALHGPKWKFPKGPLWCGAEKQAFKIPFQVH